MRERKRKEGRDGRGEIWVVVSAPLFERRRGLSVRVGGAVGASARVGGAVGASARVGMRVVASSEGESEGESTQMGGGVDSGGDGRRMDNGGGGHTAGGLGRMRKAGGLAETVGRKPQCGTKI